jgi:hypothetical protein
LSNENHQNASTSASDAKQQTLNVIDFLFVITATGAVSEMIMTEMVNEDVIGGSF